MTEKAKKLSSLAIFIVMAILAIMVLITPSMAVGDAPPLVKQDWIVTQDEIVENTTIILNGKLSVEKGATLTLRNVTLKIVTQGPDRFQKEDSLKLVIADSSLVAKDCTFEISGKASCVIKTNKVKDITIENSVFKGVGLDIWDSDEVLISQNKFLLSNDWIFQGITLSKCRNAQIINNSIIPQDEKTFIPIEANSTINLISTHYSKINGNTMRGLFCGIGLYMSWNNEIRNNTWVGGIMPQDIDEKLPNWWVTSTYTKAEGAIELGRCSNNNIVDSNTLMNTGSAMIILHQSTNNQITNNKLTGVGYGIMARISSDNLIAGNELTDVWDDAILAYRCDGLRILNNKIQSANTGVSLLDSDNNTVQANIMNTVERGFFLHFAKKNQYINNSVTGAYEGFVAADSGQNSMKGNSIINTTSNVYDDAKDNAWGGNYWGNFRGTEYVVNSSQKDKTPSKEPVAVKPAVVEAIGALPFTEVNTDKTMITGDEVWSNRDIVLKQAIIVEAGGSLVLDHVNITFEPDRPVPDLWIEVRAGGSLEVYNSSIIGPERGYALSIKGDKGSKYIIKNSTIENAGSWVATYDAALYFECDNAVIENNVIKDTFCAISTEDYAPQNARIVNNTIINTVKGITLVTNMKNALVSNNKISKTAYWGIQAYTNGPNETCIIRDNEISDGWGVGIFITHYGCYTTLSNNTFKNMRGPSMLLMDAGYMNVRQTRVLSHTPSVTGSQVEFSVLLSNTEIKDGSKESVDYINKKQPTVYALGNSTLYASQKVSLPLGGYQRVAKSFKVNDPQGYSIIIGDQGDMDRWLKGAYAIKLKLTPSNLLKPSAPVWVAVTTGRTSATLTWKPVAGAISYKVYYKKQNGQYISVTTKNYQITIPSLSSNTVYYFKVSAVSSQGEGGSSSEVVKRTSN